MEGQAINIAEMPIGTQFHLKGDDALLVKFLRVLESTPRKTTARNGTAVEPQPYAQMRFGTTSFTINTPEDIDIVSDAAKRADVYAYTLEITEFQQPVIDAVGNPVLIAGTDDPQMETRRGLAFVDLMTFDSKIKRAVRTVQITGAVKAEEAKWKTDTTDNVDAVATALYQKMKAAEALEA